MNTTERKIVWRHQVQPGLNVLVEDSLNILLELTTPDGSEVIARSSPLGNCGSLTATLEMAACLDTARSFVAATEDENDEQRRAWVREHYPATAV